MKYISSRDNPTVRLLHELGTSARERRKLQRCVLDGAHLVDAWLTHRGVPLLLAVAESKQSVPEIAALMRRAAGAQLVVLSDAVFAHASTVESPAGVMAMAEMPATPPLALAGQSCLVLDAVQDAGNLGTLLRTAAAAGLRSVLLTEGCAQAWSPKVLRAGMGAHFLLDIHEHVRAEEALAAYAGKVIATRLDARASLYDIDLRGPVAWLFGNEGAGLSQPVDALATERVRIPMPGAAESLNVAAAAAVCLFEQVRQQGAAR